MMNTNEKLQAHIAAYMAVFPFTNTERDVFEVCGITVTVDSYEYSDLRNHREAAHLVLEKGGHRYECDCIDRHRWDFYPVTVEGKPYLLFSKTLYGFTLLDPETLTEAYDYFPEKVLEGEESFIITHAQTFGKYLIFDGCYWGCPYEFCAYHHATKRLVSLTQAYGIQAGDHTAEVAGDTLRLQGDDRNWRPAETIITESDIDRLMTGSGTTDF